MSAAGRKIGMIVVVLVASALLAAALFFLPTARKHRIVGRTLTDLAGRDVRVSKEVRRVIALGPGSLRFVVYLGAIDRVVGIEDFEKRMTRDIYERPYASMLGDEFMNLPVVGTGGPGALPNLEQVLMCRPDLIVAVNIDPAQLDNIQAKTGVPTIYLSYGELGVWRQEARRSLSLLGEILGKQERATKLNQYVAALQKDLKHRTADIDEKDKPSVYFGGISYKGARGLTSTEKGYPPARMAGARNLADDLDKSGHFLVDKEQILVWNPDFIFVDAGSRLIMEKEFEENRDFYRLLKVAKSGRILSLLPYNFYNTNIELALLNAYFIGKTLYPDRFADVSIAEKAGQIMQTFLGIRPDHEIPAFRTLRFPESGPIEWK